MCKGEKESKKGLPSSISFFSSRVGVREIKRNIMSLLRVRKETGIVSQS